MTETYTFTSFATVNPFYAGRSKLTAPTRQKPVYAKLPQAPLNGSPVPHLTSLYHNPEPGPYGDRGYPGNCGGNLIRDLLLYFQPKGPILDPMSGSGTCRDVCDELGLPCIALDIHQDSDACDPQGFPIAEAFDFIWAHPPDRKTRGNSIQGWSILPSARDNCGIRLVAAGRVAGATPAEPTTRKCAMRPEHDPVPPAPASGASPAPRPVAEPARPGPGASAANAQPGRPAGTPASARRGGGS